MAAAKPNFDGNWSVLIVTEKGTCDRAYRYPVKIENGSVGYAGSASFTVSGKVGDNGAVTVTVARGSQSANGTGRMSGYRRRRHLDRGFGRLLRHLDRRTPFVSFCSATASTDLSPTSKLKARRKPGFFSFRRCRIRFPADRPWRQTELILWRHCGETESPAPKHTTQSQHSPDTDAQLACR